MVHAKRFMPCYHRICIILFLFFSGYCEEVGKFRYLGIAEDLNNKTIQFPTGVVAMNEHVRIASTLDSTSQQGASSVIFVIDNTGSMIPPQANDMYGARFTVTRALIDTLYRKNPKVKVGLVIFESYLLFKPGEDQVFVQCPQVPQGAYIAPLTLDGNYQGRTGFAVLMNYLKTQTAWQGHTELVYKNDAGSMTCINNAFAAAKHGQLNCGLPKNRQFLIFLSDGIANDAGSFPTATEYVKGTDVPTTFTVFLQWEPTDPPPDLVNMTNNIKANGYSSVNPKSNIWSIQTSHDKLMKLLMDNVMLQIINNLIVFTPNQLTVNSVTTPNGWDGNGFLFGKLFPLLGKQTNFGYSIKYSVMKDSITPNGDTLHIVLQDTTHDIKYIAEVLPNVPVPNQFALCKWGRTMGFYAQNGQVGMLNETMKTVGLRFTKYKIDTLYDYTGVKVDIMSVKGGDKEKYSLADNGGYLSVEFPLATAVTKTGDGIVQHLNTDSIVAVFRNPELPLDTLMIAVPYQLSTIFSLSHAVYFDNDANGFVDSLFIGVAGKTVKDNADALLQKMTLPQQRQFVIQTVYGYDGGIGVAVKENASKPTTYTTAEDVIVINDTAVLTQGGILLPGTVNCIDSVAPIIMTASMVDSLNVSSRDELSIEFSETIQTISQKNPLEFYCTGQSKVYDAQLEVISQGATAVLFDVRSLSGVASVTDGDSVRINWKPAGNVYDAVGNNQDNPLNIRRRIAVTVIKEVLKVNEGVFFDNNADGHVDSLYVGISGDANKIQECVDGIVKTLRLPDYRQLTIQQYLAGAGGIGLRLNEASEQIRTAVSAKDVVVVPNDTTLPQGVVLVASTVSIVDSMAPVIMNAHFRDSLKTGARDELTVVLSEPVQPIIQSAPFEFYQTSAKKVYNADLSVLSQQKETASFTVDVLIGVSGVEQGDSIRINWIYPFNVIDTTGNNQSNPGNLRRPITVVEIPESYNLVLKATLLKRQSSTIIEPEIADLPGIKQVLDNVEKDKDGYRGIMVVTLEPDSINKVSAGDSLSAGLVIYDCVGNPVLAKTEMAYDKIGKRLVCVWEGSNELERAVGPGAYLAIVSYTRFYKNVGIDKGQKLKPVGVQQGD